MRTITSIIAISLYMSLTHASETDLKPLKRYEGSIYNNSCTISELRKANKSINLLAPKKQPALAFKIVQSLLCGTKESDVAYIAEHTSKTVHRVSSHGSFDGTLYESDVSKSEVKLVNKQAWGTDISRDDEGIQVSYLVSDECNGRFFIRPIGSDWEVFKIADYCE